jgi:hypothetical protein
MSDTVDTTLTPEEVATRPNRPWTPLLRAAVAPAWRRKTRPVACMAASVWRSSW